ncbi:hypothetical protein P9D43_26940 [Neobacillus niacini]|uniref:hypothetical protein n=1 Tax=Neobacillus niacini TaxID=86668 RepID=UPI0007AB4A80|nr:hypothetical protein [Neobacillus niacini]MEC1525643.1 hypothetical protein [Neobacillus niacini]
MENRIEALLWSIALPGFSQLLNGKLIKGILFVFLEILFNVQGNFNTIILLSFHGDIEKAISQTNYQWLMFYPCMYFFAMWFGYKDAGGRKDSYSFLPFVFSAYSVTVGCIYSSSFRLFGFFIGPVWLPILCVLPGVIVGIILRKILLKRKRETTVG